MHDEKKREDYGIVGPYETAQGLRWGVRLRIGGRGGRLIERKGLRTKSAARALRDKLRTERHDDTFDETRVRQRRAKGTTIADLLTLVVEDYKRNSRRHPTDAEQARRFWTQWKGTEAAASVNGTMLKDWADQLLARDLAASTVNNKIGKLLRGFRLALEEDPPRVRQIPSWKSLKPAPPRSGFFEIEPYLAVRAALPRHAQIPVTIGFWTGMRYGEIRSITWPQVTFQHPEQLVRMQLTGYTKNGLPRQVIMGGDLYATLWAWRQEIQASSCRFVCQRHDRRLGTIDTGWKTACVKLGLATGTWVSSRGMWNNYVGPVFHDLRRTGLRNLIRAGVDRDVAMSISGHLTERVFTRYNIVNEEDLAEAGRKVAAYYAARAQSGV